MRQGGVIIGVILMVSMILLAGTPDADAGTVGTAEKKGGVEVTWTLVRDGIIEKVYDVEIKNTSMLSVSPQTLTVDVLLDNLSFSSGLLGNVDVYNWKATSYQEKVYDYENVLQEKYPIYSDTDPEQIIGYENRWIYGATGFHYEETQMAGWVQALATPTLSLSNVRKFSSDNVILPSMNSTPVLDDYGTIINGAGTIRMRIVINTPIQTVGDAFGSTGRLALIVNGVEFCPWWNTTWKYKKEITIDETYVTASSDLTDYPLLVSITDADLQSHVGYENGQDISFVDATETVQLDHEIENYDNSTGTLVAWVRIPTLDFNDDTTIFMYYGNPTAGYQENPTGVWDDNYVGVWHLDETSGTHYDSTQYANDIDPQNGVNQDEVGVADGADNFDGSDDYLNANTSSDFDLNESMTIEAWFTPATLAPNSNPDWKDVVLAKDDSDGISGDYGLDISNTKFDFWINENGTRRIARDTTNPVVGQTYHMAGTWSQELGTMYVLINGTVEDTYSPLYSFVDAGDPEFRVGHLGFPGFEYQFDGMIDEVRVSNVLRFQGWLETQYNNIDDPDTFLSVGSELAYGNWTIIENWDNCTVNAPADWSIIENWDNCTVTTDNEPSFDNVSLPLEAMPRSVILITANMLHNPDTVTEVSAVLHTSGCWHFPENVPVTENDENVEYCPICGLYHATWEIAVPLIEDNYDVYVEWAWTYDGERVQENTDNATVEVMYHSSAANGNGAGGINVVRVDDDGLPIISIALALCALGVAGSLWRREESEPEHN